MLFSSAVHTRCPGTKGRRSGDSKVGVEAGGGQESGQGGESRSVALRSSWGSSRSYGTRSEEPMFLNRGCAVQTVEKRPLCTLLHAPPAIAYIQFSHGPIYWSMCQINTTKISPVLGIHNLLCIRIYENTAVIRICRHTSTHYTLSIIFKVWRSTLLLDWNPRVLHLYWYCQLLWAGSTDTHLTTTEFHCMVTKLT